MKATFADDGDAYSHLACVQITDEPTTARGRACPRCHLIHAGECF